MSLKDIAAEVGVSISTVSRVLNTDNSSVASKELQRRIWDTAKKQGYIPNLNARKLKHNSAPGSETSRSLCCLYGCAPQETKDDPFFTKLLEVIEKEAFRYNFHVGCTFSSTALEFLYTSPVRPLSESDCLIILGRFHSELLKKLNPAFKKIVYIGLNALDVPCDQILCDGYKLIEAGVNYFYSLGHRNIAFIGSKEARMRGYLDAMANLGLAPDDRLLVHDAVLSMEGGYHGMLQLLEQAPYVTAVCSGNDMVAIGVLKACKERKIRVPEDVSILGLNDIENVQYTDPMLSSIRVPLEEMGKMAVTMMIDRINNGHSSPVKVEFPFQIIKRESCRTLDGQQPSTTV